MGGSYPDRLVTLQPPAVPLAALAEASVRVGAPAAQAPPGLQVVLDEAHALVDGPDGVVGRCFRLRTLRAMWEAESVDGSPLALPGGNASSLMLGIEGEQAGTIPSPLEGVRVATSGNADFALLDDWPVLDPGQRLLADYSAGPAGAEALRLANGAVLRIVAQLWMDRLTAAHGLPAALAAVRAALWPYRTGLRV